MFRCGTEAGQQPKPSNCFPRIPPLSNCTNPPLSSCTNPPNGFPNIPPLLNTTPQTNCFSNFSPPRNCNHSPSECCRQQQVVIHHHHYYYYPPHWNNLPPPYNFSQTPNVPNPIGFSLHRDLPKPPSVCRPPVPWCTTTDELSKNRTPSPPASSHKNIYWKDSSLGQEMPLGAVAGGTDIDGESIYVGRAYHEGDWLPAKVIPGRKCCYVSYNGLEHPKTSYQILCDSRSTWLPAKNGEIQPDAVEGGVTDNGEKLYIGRVRHNGSLTVGKIHPSHGVCYIPFDGKEINFPEYEVLISGWLTKPHVAAGRGKYFDFNEEEEKSEEKYEEETEQKSEEEKKQDDEISIGFEDLFNDNDYTTWETTDLDNMPPGAVEGGYDADGSPIFVGRAFHEGDWMPAKVIPSKKYVAVSYGGAEYSKTSFQVLCAPHAEWVPGFNGQVPPDAIEGGKTAYGEKLYIGRAKYLSSLTVGKIHPSYGLCYIPFGQKEISYPEYEVLVSGRSNVSKDPEPILPFRKGGKKGYRRCGKRNFRCEVID